ncbi:MAG: hypothetical protein IJJ95_05755 [Spirochaetales bacterium]|nr:hypothetical protein [Spirochaetales bacterium]
MEIKMMRIDEEWGRKTGIEPLLNDCIQEMTTSSVSILKGDKLEIAADDHYHVFILISGSITAETGGKTIDFNSRTTFLPAPDDSLLLKAHSDSGLLYIRVLKHGEDSQLLKEYGTVFPYIMPYESSKQYWDVHKTKKTIPRIMLEQRTIPRMCMGSCESLGYDEIIAHAHPMLDQYFYSFPENHTTVSIDDEKIDFQGNMIMYIPLGSNHGSTVDPGNHLHYVWIDFFNDTAGMKRLDTMHQSTGLNRTIKDL